MAAIYKKQSGIYEIQYFIDGKRYRKSLRTKDENEAKDKKKAKEAEILILGNTDYQKKLKIENAFIEYLHYKKLVLKESSYTRIEYIYAKR